MRSLGRAEAGRPGTASGLGTQGATERLQGWGGLDEQQGTGRRAGRPRHPGGAARRRVRPAAEIRLEPGGPSEPSGNPARSLREAAASWDALLDVPAEG